MSEPASGRRSDLEPILAGVVVYRPDGHQLAALVATLKAQTAGVVLFLNGPLPDRLSGELAASADVTLIEAGANLGIGVGLNVLALAACLREAGAMVFFDQDSVPPADLVPRLRVAWATLLAAGHRPAVVSPQLVAAPGTAGKAPTYRYRATRAPGRLREVAFVPTSGSLVSTEVLRRTGFFRADFFIDGIDLEWSFRARHQGYSCWIDAEAAMPHSVGSGAIGVGFGRRMPRQRPFRMYCLVRNTLYGLRLRHVPLGWKARQLAYLPLQMTAFVRHHGGDRSVVRLLFHAVRDGISGRLGPPRGLPD